MTTSERGLLDTSVVVSPLVARSDVERAARQSVLQQVEADFHPIPFDDRATHFRPSCRAASSFRS